MPFIKIMSEMRERGVLRKVSVFYQNNVGTKATTC